jgi:replication factor C subunit 3/5
MSDIDEMELDDERIAETERTFDSGSKGKKLSKANLPVSAGDTLPWCVAPV